MNWLNKVLHRFGRLINSSTADMVQSSYDESCNLNVLRDNPIARKTLVDSSIYEDKYNSQYSGILNTMSNHTVGTIPLPVALSDSDRLNDAIEDRWLEWGMMNSIGSSLREFRRKAAQQGVAAMIPYKSNSDYDLKLSYRVVGAEHFQTPRRRAYSALNDPFLNRFTGQHVEGVEFHPNGEVRRVWIKEEHKYDPTPYEISDGVIVWFKQSRPFPFFPECTPAFHVIPSMNRFLQNVIREQEFKSAVPMAVRLDPDYYSIGKSAPPKGAFKYEPGTIPTLPPGTDLVSVAMASMAEDRAKISDMFCAVAARAIDMPKILALMDSSSSNMATAHIDLQPWKYVVDIDRFDFEVAVRRVFKMWYSMASSSTLLPSSSYGTSAPPVLFNYTVLFNHPDPTKCANARATDLISGASTLSIQYSEQSRNARREIEKECKLFNITKEKYLELLLASRSKQALEVLNATEEDSSEDEVSQELLTAEQN